MRGEFCGVRNIRKWKEKNLTKNLGKYFLDISKLIFAGVVLATIIKIEDINKLMVLGLGVFAATGFAVFGFIS